jgi:hypothetical protein
MFHVRVGLVPVWTTVGKADNEPIGIDGLVAWARARFGTRVPSAIRAADTATSWLVFMAGCKGGCLEKPFRPGSQKRDFS